VGFVINKAIKTFFHIDLSSSSDGLFSRLELWNSFVVNFDHSKIFLGNGLKSAYVLIVKETSQEVNNLHNVFFNITWEAGLLCTFIVSLIYARLFGFISKSRSEYFDKFQSIVWFAPFFVCINSHYLGYDADIMIYLSSVFLMANFYLPK